MGTLCIITPVELRIASGRGSELQVRRQARQAFGEQRRKYFLETLAATCNVRLSAETAGVGIGTCYKHRARDPIFAEAWKDALAIGYDRLEEALLTYATSQVAAATFDPDVVDPADVEGHFAASTARGTVTHADLQFALALLNRHRAAVEGRDTAGQFGRRATREESDALLRRKLDSLSRRTRDQ